MTVDMAVVAVAAVYRLYDATGALLYIGASCNPTRRYKDHASRRPWWREVYRREVEWHPTRAAALAAEREAIKSDRPRYNKVHRDPNPPGVSAALLAAIGEAAHLVKQRDRELQQVIADARADGVPWKVVGKALGVSRQAAQQRFKDVQ